MTSKDEKNFLLQNDKNMIHWQQGYGGCSSAGRALGCGPSGRGFKSHHSPHMKKLISTLHSYERTGIGRSREGLGAFRCLTMDRTSKTCQRNLLFRSWHYPSFAIRFAETSFTPGLPSSSMSFGLPPPLFERSL
jgi:hypothetical protein